MILTAFIDILCIGFITWILKNRSKKIILKSQPQFMIICLVGVMINSCSIITLGVDDSKDRLPGTLSFTCNASWWFWSIGSTIVYSSLITKMYRIHKIFVNPTLRAMKITNLLSFYHKQIYFQLSQIQI